MTLNEESAVTVLEHWNMYILAIAVHYERLVLKFGMHGRTDLILCVFTQNGFKSVQCMCV